MNKAARHKGYRRHLKKKYRRIAAAIAGLVVMSASALPGLPATVAHAAVNPKAGAPAPVTAQLKTPQEAKALKGEAPSEFKKELNMVATAYAPGPHDNDQWGNKTHLGTTVRPGIIAVDPSVIPLGSKVFVQYPDGHGEYLTAEDTGGAIKGNRIDIAKSSVREAEKFGMQNVKVFVVSTPTTQQAKA